MSTRVKSAFSFSFFAIFAFSFVTIFAFLDCFHSAFLSLLQRRSSVMRGAISVRSSSSLCFGTPKLFNSARVAVNGLSCNAMFDLGVPKLVVIVGVPKKLPEVERSIDKTDGTNMAVKESSEMASSLNQEPRKGMILPFQPLSLAFNHISYYVDMSAFAYAFLTLACYDYKNFLLADEMRNQLQLLQDVSGAFRPGILTTLVDVFAGRKIGGYIEGSITI
ncbi:ABC transporter G family member 39 [Glycine soja]